MDEILNQFQQRYQQLRAMREAGQLNPQQFIAEVQKLRWQDGSRVWWAINSDGVFLRFDGRQWIPVEPSQITPIPPQIPAEAPAAPPLPVQVPAQPWPAAPSLPVQVPAQPWPAAPPRPVQAPGQPRITAPGSSLRTFAPIMAVIPSLVCATLWFLYTFIGVFKSEGIGGIDCVTPLIVGGLPVLFWVLKKPIDKLLLPLKPVIKAVPKPLRLGIALAVPIVLACGCSALSSSGYLALNVSAFVSVMTAAVLLRF